MCPFSLTNDNDQAKGNTLYESKEKNLLEKKLKSSTVIL